MNESHKATKVIIAGHLMGNTQKIH